MNRHHPRSTTSCFSTWLTLAQRRDGHHRGDGADQAVSATSVRRPTTPHGVDAARSRSGAKIKGPSRLDPDHAVRGPAIL